MAYRTKVSTTDSCFSIINASTPAPGLAVVLKQSRLDGVREVVSAEPAVDVCGCGPQAGGVLAAEAARPAKSSTTAASRRRRSSTTATARLYTGASSPSLFSSLLSALWAVGHVQASADAASSIIASASQVRIFHRGLSLQRLAKYNATASALAS